MNTSDKVIVIDETHAVTASVQRSPEFEKILKDAKKTVLNVKASFGKTKISISSAPATK